MIETLIISGVGVITGAISSVVTWILAKRKYDSEVKGSEIANMDAALAFYKKLNDDMNDRLQQVLERNSKLEQRNNRLEEKNDRLERDVNELRRQMLDLSLRICLRLSCTKRINEPLECEPSPERYKDSPSSTTTKEQE